jgi:hypothetical protein
MHGCGDQQSASSDVVRDWDSVLMSDAPRSTLERGIALQRALWAHRRNKRTYTLSFHDTVEYRKLCNHALMRWRLRLPLLATELVVAGRRLRENLRKPPRVLPVTEFRPASRGA